MATKNLTKKEKEAAAKKKNAELTPTTQNKRSLIGVLAYLNRDHPSGRFRRGEVTFTNQPTVYHLTSDQIDDLKTISHIVNLRFDRESIERFSKSKADKGVIIGKDESIKKSEEKKDDEDEAGIPADFKDVSQEEIIAKLEEKGLVGGKDFEPNASKKSLIDILLA